MVQIRLMLEVLFTQDSKVEDLRCSASSGSEYSLFFINYFFSLGFKPVPDDFQHDFAQMTDEADRSVVQAELQVALLRKCNNQRLSPWGMPFSCSPDHGVPTSVFQIRTINRPKLDKRQVSVDRFPEKVKVESIFILPFPGLQNIFEIILFTAPSQKISRCSVNL